MKLFELIETIDNEEYFVKCFASSYYDLNVIRNKKFDYENFELSVNGNQPFVPSIYISRDITNDRKFEIKIQTTSYGSLSEQEFSYFIEVQKKALKYIEEIKHIIENE